MTEGSSETAESSSASSGFFDRATKLVKAWGTYVLGLGALIVGWNEFAGHAETFVEGFELGPLNPWRVHLLFAIPLAIIAVTGALDFQKTRTAKQRRLWAAKSPPKPGFFRLTPYQYNDQGRFTRTDGVHERVFAWLRDAEQPLLYLTGRSGSGKSSILNAHVIPAIKAAPVNARVVEARAYGDPLAAIAEAFVIPRESGVPGSKKSNDLDGLLQKALRDLEGRRLILILDQFEEFVILNEHEDTRAPLRDFLKRVTENRYPGLTLLLSLRDDYLAPTRAALDLPLPEPEKTWQQVPLFVRSTAQAFLEASHEGGLADELVSRVLEQAGEMEGNPGLYRPITLNMLGLVLAESTQRRKGGVPEELLHEYLRRRLGAEIVRDHAPGILRLMLTRFHTKRPLTEGEIQAATKYRPIDIEGTLAHLETDGIVRRLDEQSRRRWEIAHDFVARLLSIVLAGWQQTFWRATRPWLGPAVIMVWVVTLGFGVPFYLDRNHGQAVAELNAYGANIVPNEDGGKSLSVVWRGSKWDAMGPVFFLEQVARLDSPIVALDFSGADELTDISAIAGLKNLQTLKFGYANEITDISAIAGLKKLQSLEFSGARELINISAVAGLENLQTLNIDGADRITDISAVAGLKNLQTLNIEDAFWITDISAVAGLKNLQTLNLRKAHRITDISAVAGLESLQNLWLNSAVRVSDISAVAGLKNLKSLNLSQAEGITDISAIAGLKNLEGLLLGSAVGITDINAVAGLKNLERLDFGSAVGITDISVVAGLKNLERLSLTSAIGVTDISAVAGLRKLQRLHLNSAVGITDISAVAGLKSLRRLDLNSAVGITDISAVADLFFLHTLNLESAEGITSAQKQELFTKLPNLRTIY